MDKKKALNYFVKNVCFSDFLTKCRKQARWLVNTIQSLVSVKYCFDRNECFYSARNEIDQFIKLNKSGSKNIMKQRFSISNKSFELYIYASWIPIQHITMIKVRVTLKTKVMMLKIQLCIKITF